MNELIKIKYIMKNYNLKTLLFESFRQFIAYRKT